MLAADPDPLSLFGFLIFRYPVRPLRNLRRSHRLGKRLNVGLETPVGLKLGRPIWVDSWALLVLA